MKICPTCNQEFANDVQDCPYDGAALETVYENDSGEQEQLEAESVETAAGQQQSASVGTADDAATGRAVSAAVQGDGAGILQKAVVVGLIVLIAGAGLVFWKGRVAGHGDYDMTRISEEEMQLLVKDFNPMQLKALADNPAQKQQLTDNLKQLLALASEAKKEGIDREPYISAELENMRMTLLARNYDNKINGDKGPMPPFGFISEDRVKAFWGETPKTGGDGASSKSPQANSNSNAGAAANTAKANDKPAKPDRSCPNSGSLTSALDLVGLGWIAGETPACRHHAEFDLFIKNKLTLLRKAGQLAKDQEPTEDELKQARDSYAKTRIYYDEVRKKLASINSLPKKEQEEWQEFEKKFQLQAKLQEAQFLVQTLVREKLSKRLEVTEKEVKKYIAEHPELTKSKEKKAKAERILKKAKEGADFAELAKEYSDDPGSKDNGGLYEDISKGQFAPEFEAAALALKPGEIADKVIKTDFGFHIIKLEKKGETKGADGKSVPTYNARHILISTMMKDPDNPLAREMPVEQFVKAKMEKEKQDKMLEEIKKNNPVHVADDFKVPEPSAEAMEQLRQRQQQQLRQLQDAAGAGDQNGKDK